MRTIEDIRELTRMYEVRGLSSPSEKLNLLTECDQSICLAYNRYTDIRSKPAPIWCWVLKRLV